METLETEKIPSIVFWLSKFVNPKKAIRIRPHMSLSRRLEYEKRIKHLKELEGKTSDPAKKRRYRKQQEELERALKGHKKTT
ncbi:MAG: hypothetical protein RBG13Loki_1222 [Promethearchaeota archaeon CR_4]|nr:MAG: hypothetical protein RBG13Loki_1222 [Candidatus Lokiarchaeota archaeon CR_4]